MKTRKPKQALLWSSKEISEALWDMWFLGEDGHPIDPKQPFDIPNAKIGKGTVHECALLLALEDRLMTYVKVGKRLNTYKLLRAGRAIYRHAEVRNKSEGSPDYLQQVCLVAIWKGFKPRA